MSVARYALTSAVLTLLCACADIPERTAWMGGVSTQDAREIAQLLRSRTPDQILEFTRDPDGSVSILLQDRHGVLSGYTARRVGNTWKLTHDTITS